MLSVLVTQQHHAEAHFATQASAENVSGVSWFSILSVLATREHHVEAHFAAQA